MKSIYGKARCISSEKRIPLVWKFRGKKRMGARNEIWILIFGLESVALLSNPLDLLSELNTLLALLLSSHSEKVQYYHQPMACQ